MMMSLGNDPADVSWRDGYVGIEMLRLRTLIFTKRHKCRWATGLNAV